MSRLVLGRFRNFIDCGLPARLHERDFRFGKTPYLLNRSIDIAPSAKISRSATLSTASGGSISVGERTSVLMGALLLTYGGSIRVGEDCSINPYCVLYGHGGLVIGNGVRIAAHTVIIPGNHVFSDRSRRIMDQGLTTQGVQIGDDVWIGAGVKVLDGVSIAPGCVIAAGAVVHSDTDEFGIYGGVPARRLKDR